MQAYIAWKRIFSVEYLKDIYDKKIRYKPSIGLDKVTPEKFSKNAENEINIIVRKTNNRSYRFTRYRQLLLIKRPEDPPREINIPTIRDKLTLAGINELLGAVYGKRCSTPLPQIIIKEVIENLQRYDSFIKIDIKQFYSSINHESLNTKLKQRIRKPEIIDLINKAITTPSIAIPPKGILDKALRARGVPEGLSISSTLANILLSDMDDKYNKRDNICYHRYVDDILILANSDEIENVYLQIKTDIENLGLNINEDKLSSGKCIDGFEYLGYVLSPQKISVRRKSVLKIEQALEDIFRKVNTSNQEYIEWKVNLRISGFVIDNKKYGWLFFYSQITDETLPFHLDDVVQKLLERYHVSESFRVKRFARAFKEIQKASTTTSYIVNFDRFEINEKRDLLSKVYKKKLDGYTDEEVEVMFRNIMRKEVVDIERDLQGFS